MLENSKSISGPSKEFKKIDKDVIKITGEGAIAEIELLEKPHSDND